MNRFQRNLPLILFPEKKTKKHRLRSGKSAISYQKGAFWGQRGRFWVLSPLFSPPPPHWRHTCPFCGLSPHFGAFALFRGGPVLGPPLPFLGLDAPFWGSFAQFGDSTPCFGVWLLHFGARYPVLGPDVQFWGQTPHLGTRYSVFGPDTLFWG